MTKEEIALQLTLKKLDALQFTESRTGNFDTSHNFNEKLGEEIATIFNSVYKNIKLDETIGV